MAKVEETLEERGSRYGNYLNQTKISHELKETMKFKGSEVWVDLKADQKDALEMIAVKISRILNGDPNYSDNWHDIAGYATLVADRLDGNERK